MKIQQKKFDGHCEWHKREYNDNENNEIQSVSVIVEWDGEGPYLTLEMTKELDGDTIILKKSSDYGETYEEEYRVNDKEFCYAVAKACTEVIKQFGFYGYRFSTEGEPIMIHQLLFLKAYALNNLEARELTAVDEWFDCYKSNFKKEIELLLFDM